MWFWHDVLFFFWWVRRIDLYFAFRRLYRFVLLCILSCLFVFYTNKWLKFRAGGSPVPSAKEKCIIEDSSFPSHVRCISSRKIFPLFFSYRSVNPIMIKRSTQA